MQQEHVNAIFTCWISAMFKTVLLNHQNHQNMHQHCHILSSSCGMKRFSAATAGLHQPSRPLHTDSPPAVHARGRSWVGCWRGFGVLQGLEGLFVAVLCRWRRTWGWLWEISVDPERTCLDWRLLRSSSIKVTYEWRRWSEDPASPPALHATHFPAARQESRCHHQ